MAKGATDQRLSGMVGPVVMYQLNGQAVMRSRPSPYKQTPATKARSKNFGMAARAVGFLIRDIESFLPPDQTKRGRLNGAVSKWMGTTPVGEIQPEQRIPELMDFHFNKNLELSSACRNQLNVQYVDEEIRVAVPAFNPTRIINAPTGTVSVECTIAASWMAFSRFSSSSDSGWEKFQFEFKDQEVPAREIKLKYTDPRGYRPGQLHLIVIAMRFILQDEDYMILKDKEQIAADIAWAEFR